MHDRCLKNTYLSIKNPMIGLHPSGFNGWTNAVCSYSENHPDTYKSWHWLRETSGKKRGELSLALLPLQNFSVFSLSPTSPLIFHKTGPLQNSPRYDEQFQHFPEMEIHATVNHNPNREWKISSFLLSPNSSKYEEISSTSAPIKISNPILEEPKTNRLESFSFNLFGWNVPSCNSYFRRLKPASNTHILTQTHPNPRMHWIRFFLKRRMTESFSFNCAFQKVQFRRWNPPSINNSCKPHFKHIQSLHHSEGVTWLNPFTSIAQLKKNPIFQKKSTSM